MDLSTAVGEISLEIIVVFIIVGQQLFCCCI